MSGYNVNSQVLQIVDRLVEEYSDQYGSMSEMMKKACTLKYRDIIFETCHEYNRCGEFVRIFPCKNSKQYEKYFSGVFGTRMLNRIVHKALFSSEVM